MYLRSIFCWLCERKDKMMDSEDNVWASILAVKQRVARKKKDELTERELGWNSRRFSLKEKKCKELMESPFAVSAKSKKSNTKKQKQRAIEAEIKSGDEVLGTVRYTSGENLCEVRRKVVGLLDMSFDFVTPSGEMIARRAEEKKKFAGNKLYVRLQKFPQVSYREAEHQDFREAVHGIIRIAEVAALKIQCLVRCTSASHRVKRLLREQQAQELLLARIEPERAALKIQRQARISLAKKRLLSIRVAHRASIKIQTVARRYLATRYIKQVRRLKDKAATKLQALTRRSSVTSSLKKQHLAAARVQSIGRRASAMKIVRTKRQQNQAATLVQSIGRRASALRLVKDKRDHKKNLAAVKVQAWGRRASAIKIVKQKRDDKQHRAAIRVQAFSRRASAIKIVKQKRDDKQHQAAIRVQAFSRRASAIKIVKQKRDDKQHQAAIRVQAFSRRASALRLTAEMRKEIQSTRAIEEDVTRSHDELKNASPAKDELEDASPAQDELEDASPAQDELEDASPAHEELEDASPAQDEPEDASPAHEEEEEEEEKTRAATKVSDEEKVKQGQAATRIQSLCRRKSAIKQVKTEKERRLENESAQAACHAFAACIACTGNIALSCGVALAAALEETNNQVAVLALKSRVPGVDELESEYDHLKMNCKTNGSIDREARKGIVTYFARKCLNADAMASKRFALKKFGMLGMRRTYSLGSQRVSSNSLSESDDCHTPGQLPSGVWKSFDETDERKVNYAAMLRNSFQAAKHNFINAITNTANVEYASRGATEAALATALQTIDCASSYIDEASLAPSEATRGIEYDVEQRNDKLLFTSTQGQRCLLGPEHWQQVTGFGTLEELSDDQKCELAYALASNFVQLPCGDIALPGVKSTQYTPRTATAIDTLNAFVAQRPGHNVFEFHSEWCATFLADEAIGLLEVCAIDLSDPNFTVHTMNIQSAHLKRSDLRLVAESLAPLLCLSLDGAYLLFDPARFYTLFCCSLSSYPASSSSWLSTARGDDYTL